MSLRTKTWDQLVESTSAYAGVTIGADTKMLTRLKSLANEAATDLHETYPFLERWLVVAEPRTVSRGQIESTEDSFHVYGAGTDEVNGLYQRNGTANGKARYSLYDSDGTTILWDIEWDNSTDWQILVGAGNTLTENTVYYDITDSSSTPPLSGWAKNASAAENPAPLLVDVAEIGVMLQVDTYNIYQDRTSQPIQFYAFNDNFPLQTPNPPKIAYCTYQKPLDTTYGDGTGGTTSTIPSEIFHYLVLYSAQQLQIATRQSNSNQLYAPVSARKVQDALDSIGMRLEHQGTIANVARRIQTQFTSDTILH